jgi:hypothetical protein
MGAEVTVFAVPAYDKSKIYQRRRWVVNVQLYIEGETLEWCDGAQCITYSAGKTGTRVFFPPDVGV